ncbi:MAG: hypothetical protein Q4C01_05045 [Clostridia bacterium]|nr:hypothetical protein [Clostridia bacterium]
MRLGLDQLNKTLIFTGLAAFLLRMLLINVPWAYYTFTGIAIVAILFFAFRLMNSRNFERRARENQAFVGFFQKIGNLFKGGSARVVREKKKPKGSGFSLRYRYLICPQCQQKLRVPRGKGSIKVTCVKCKHQFLAKS